MTESKIARSIWLRFGQSGITAHNIYYYPLESDVLILRPSGRITEYEIKLSKADFERDVKKKVSSRIKTNGMNRYDFVRMGHGANNFYYVIPKELHDKIEVPKWAGIITCWDNGVVGRCALNIERKAKTIHTKKASDNAKEKIMTAMYYKYWNHL